MAAVIRVDGLLLKQPPHRIGPLWFGRRLRAFTRIEAFESKAESGKRAQESPEFTPGILASVDHNRRHTVALLNPPVDGGALHVQAILMRAGSWKIGGTQVPHGKAGSDLLYEPRVALLESASLDARERRTDNRLALRQSLQKPQYLEQT